MWKIFWDHINEEMDLIKNAPILSSVIFIVAISIAYIMAKWRYGKAIDILKLHCDFLKEKLDNLAATKTKPIIGDVHIF